MLAPFWYSNQQMVALFYEFKMEGALFMGTGLLKDSGRPSNLMEPFSVGADMMAFDGS